MEGRGKYESWESEEMRGGRRSWRNGNKRLNLLFSLKGRGGGGERTKRDRGGGRGGGEEGFRAKEEGRGGGGEF